MYARSDHEFAVTVPPREYELAARLLVQAVEADPSDRSRTALAGAARRLGAELGSAFRPAAGEGDAAGRDVKGVLTQQGYEPCGGANGVIRLRNCPFHQLAERHRELVCGMNLALVEGLVDRLGADGWHAALDPRPGRAASRSAVTGHDGGTVPAHRAGRRGVDIDAAERAAASFLAALGIDVDHEDLRETPARMARAYAELFTRRRFD